MDGYSGKRGGSGLMTPRKGYNSKDTANEREHNVQFCNRIGCSGRIKYSQNMKGGSLEKAKISKPAFRSSNGSGMSGNSSGGSSSTTSTKRSCLDSKRKKSSELALDPSESCISGESEAPDFASSSSNSPTKNESEIMRKSGKGPMSEFGSSSVTSTNRTPKTFYHKSRSRDQNTAPASSTLLISKSASIGPLNNSNRSRYGLRNLKCNSISDAVPPSFSPSESASVGKNMIKGRSAEGESSSSRRGRKSAPAASEDGNNCPSSSSLVISDSRRGSSISREDTSNDASVRNQRSINMNSRMRISYRHSGRNMPSIREPRALNISSSPDNDILHYNVGERSSSQFFPPNISSSSSSSYSLSSSNDDNASNTMSFTNADLGLTHFMNRDALRRYNMDGIAEVLLALERIEQDEELTHEQVLALETSLFLSGLNFYDQHRDMRLDIDNMSYEELLALEERMGTVSTALPEEALSKCVKRSIYEASEVRLTGTEDDDHDMKCSICQEEYVVGDEIGKLVQCQHGYHGTCINQWLRLKNWCPICKAAVAPSQTSS